MTITITQTTTLRELATRCPEIIPRLEDLKLDYCCGGETTLEEAASRIGVQAPALVDDLETWCAARADAPAEADWAAMGMEELADHIEQVHHAFVRETVERLAELMPRVVKAHAETDAWLPELALTVERHALSWTAGVAASWSC